MTLFSQLKRLLLSRYHRYSLRRATTRAYQTFSRQYPRWEAQLFDRHFVFAHLLPLLQKTVSTGEELKPAQVAEMWARQIFVSPKARQKYTVQALPIATYFLRLVAAEFAGTQAGHVNPLRAAIADGQPG